VIDAMDRAGRIPNADLEDWEDRIIAAQRRIRTAFELANTGNSL
jgi:hypothetical protein